MIAGFAMVAYPAQYGESGVMTFIVSHNGKVFEKDLGKNSATIGANLHCVRSGCRLEGSRSTVAAITRRVLRREGGDAMVRSRFTNTRGARDAVAAAAVGLSAVATPASASFLSGEALDTAATYIAWFVVCVVPIVVIVLFWMVHVMPEKIAEKRHHPQKDAIHTLCLLSLVFGGLLWPFAWLWAYTKPVGYRLAYGTEKHDDYYVEMGEEGEGRRAAG